MEMPNDSWDAHLCFGKEGAKYKICVVLERLMLGGRVGIGEHTYVFDTDHRLCVVGWNATLNQETLLVADWNLSEFIKLVSQMTDKEILVVGYSNAMGRK